MMRATEGDRPPDDRASAQAMYSAMQGYFAARDHILTTMRAWITWWRPIRKQALEAYQELDEEDRMLIDALESLWRMGPDDAAAM